jgi:hypothetical protein
MGLNIKLLYNITFNTNRISHGNRKNGFNSLIYRLVIVSPVIGLRPCDRPTVLWNRSEATSQDEVDHHLTSEAITFCELELFLRLPSQINLKDQKSTANTKILKKYFKMTFLS